MSWLGFLKDSPQLVTDSAKDLRSGIDLLVYTDEEKAQARQKGFEIWIKQQETIANESTHRPVTRRSIAVDTSRLFLLLVGVSALAYPISSAWCQHILDVLVGTNMVVLVGLIMTFYFGPSHIAPAFNAMRNRKDNES